MPRVTLLASCRQQTVSLVCKEDNSFIFCSDGKIIVHHLNPSSLKVQNETVTCRFEVKPVVAMPMMVIIKIRVLTLTLSNVCTPIKSSTTKKLTNQLRVYIHTHTQNKEIN